MCTAEINSSKMLINVVIQEANKEVRVCEVARIGG